MIWGYQAVDHCPETGGWICRVGIVRSSRSRRCSGVGFGWQSEEERGSLVCTGIHRFSLLFLHDDTVKKAIRVSKEWLLPHTGTDSSSAPTSFFFRILKRTVQILRGNCFVWWLSTRYVLCHEPIEINNIPLILPRRKQAVEKEQMTSWGSPVGTSFDPKEHDVRSPTSRVKPQLFVMLAPRNMGSS